MGDESSDAPDVKDGRYANFFKVGYSEFEFLVDFGQLFQQGDTPHLHTRIVTGPVFAKALGQTLRDSVEEFEAKYGPIPELGPEE
jgi:hypothetical protein